jgi:hypothetical protein
MAGDIRRAAAQVGDRRRGNTAGQSGRVPRPLRTLADQGQGAGAAEEGAAAEEDRRATSAEPSGGARCLETDFRGIGGLQEQGRSGAGQTDCRLRQGHADDDKDNRGAARPAARPPRASARAYAGAYSACVQPDTQRAGNGEVNLTSGAYGSGVPTGVGGLTVRSPPTERVFSNALRRSEKVGSPSVLTSRRRHVGRGADACPCGTGADFAESSAPRRDHFWLASGSLLVRILVGCCSRHSQIRVAKSPCKKERG